MFTAFAIGVAMLVIGMVSAIVTLTANLEPDSVRFITREQRHPNHTPYTGPNYNRHDREIQQ